MLADGQAAWEKAFTALLFGLSNVNILFGIGTIESEAWRSRAKHGYCSRQPAYTGKPAPLQRGP